ncbi:MAG TPA: TcpE family conjugal transfer membrane protein [Streptosporangiaceae bacterium]|nr:TcpE family conjugal transfer membrane protein [Streptosporangiaceae bacterium]
MDLPTYTSIWRIEKRLYKLYDFRLPMPLPIGQITVFAAIAVPYVVLLTLLGLPFNHSLIWLYVLPPGVATWLVTRPVLESKRLPELVRSQLRYVAEPRVWCRMAPLAEKDVIVVTGRVWRLSAPARERLKAPQAAASRKKARRLVPASVPALTRRSRSRPGPGQPAGSAARVRRQSRVTGAGNPGRGNPVVNPAVRGNAGVFTRQRTGAQALTGLLRPPARPPAHQAPPADRVLPAGRLPASDWPPAPPRPARAPTAPPTRPAAGPALASRAPALEASPPVTMPMPAGSPAPGPDHDHHRDPDHCPDPDHDHDHHRDQDHHRDRQRGPGDQPAARPAITVVGNALPQEPPPSVERALAGPSARRGDIKTGRVTVVPGGHRPGKPDQLQRDRARARQPIDGPRRVVVLGCTVGAGQTVTTLLTGELLASLRTDLVAVLDLNPGPVSLAHRALMRPALSRAASAGQSRLAILASGTGERTDRAGAAIAFEQASIKHQIVLADPSTTAVPRMLAIADQLILVAPASGTAARAIGMTFEWLEAHGQGSLASGAIMVLNGVSRRSAEHVEHAERVCVGQCRAMVRVPWDDQLANHSVKKIRQAAQAAPASPQRAGLLSPATVSAYTALAGVLVTALAGSAADAAAAIVPPPTGGRVVR